MRLYILFASLIFMISCSNSTNNNKDQNANTDANSSVQPAAGDTTKQPTGMDNSSAISTDTAAMNYQNSIKKVDSLNKKKSK